MSETQQLLYSINNAAQMLDCSRVTIYRMVKQGQLEAVPFGKKSQRITAESLHNVARTGVPKLRETTESE